MNKTTVFILIASLILGSSLSLVLAGPVSNKIPIQLLSKSIPGVSDQLISQKNFDLTEFLLTFIFTILVFGFNLFSVKYLQKRSGFSISIIPSLLLVIFSLFIFIQTRFISFSRTNVLIFIFFIEVFFLVLSFVKVRGVEIFSDFYKLSRQEKVISFANGVLAGFYLLLLLNQLTQITTLPLGVFLGIIILFLYFGLFNKDSPIYKLIYSFPGPLTLISFFFPTNILYLSILGILIIIAWLLIVNFKSNLFFRISGLTYLYPALLVFLLSYNPNFFIGNFDSVEEGFILGWIQRLSLGQVLYKDVAVYHPPFLIWGMYLFSFISGFSIYSERLFLHLMQITGTIIYFLFLQKVLNKTWVKVVILLLFMSLTSILVRNNLEIRVGVGLLALLPLFEFFNSRRLKWLLLSGALSVMAFFVSIETGIVTILTLVLSLNLFSGKNIIKVDNLKNNLFLILGLLIAMLPIVTYLVFTGALNDFYYQVTFYASAFSKGYFNSPVERAVSLSYFHFHIFNEYISSHAFFWEMAKFLIIGSFLFFLYKYISTKRLDLVEKKLLTVAIFGLIMFRVALGRSDWYHFLSVLSVSLILFGYLLERISKWRPVIAGVLAFATLFLFARVQVNSVFLENLFFRMQTYGRVIGDYNYLTFERAPKIPIDKTQDADSINRLVERIQRETTPNEVIFAYPWMPEIYFFTKRRNATRIDTPYAFFDESFQDEMISELEKNKPKFIVYGPDMNFGGLSVGALPKVNQHISTNYKTVDSFGKNTLLVRK